MYLIIPCWAEENVLEKANRPTCIHVYYTMYDNYYYLSSIHSGYFYSTSSSSLLHRSAPSTDTVSEFYAEAPQATASEGLDQGPNVAAKAGFEPATLRTTGVESTNEPPSPT